MSDFGSHSEFGKLREVVVGSAQDLHLPPYRKDVSHYNDELRDALLKNGNKALDVQKYFPERYEETVEQMRPLSRSSASRFTGHARIRNRKRITSVPCNRGIHSFMSLTRYLSSVNTISRFPFAVPIAARKCFRCAI